MFLEDYSGIVAAIKEGKRHVPQHQQPESLAAGGAVKSYIRPANELLFEDFRWFGAVMNREVAEPWSIEELPNTDVRDWFADVPEVGRRYQVYYNACEMGTVQVRVGGYDYMDPERFAENRQALALIDLNYLRFVPYEDAHSLIYTIVLFVGSFENGDAARARAAAEATAMLSEHLWETVRKPDIDMSFMHRTEGPYELLRHTTDHWKTNGIDPFEKWGGDRMEAKG